MVRIAALLVSILLGVTAGFAVADMREPEPPSDADGAKPPAPIDPLHLGIDMVNPSCDGRGILILTASDNRGELRQAISDHPHAKYLETANSCATLYEETAKSTPAYAVYLGPYESFIPPCRRRLSPDGRGSVVTGLDDTNENLVKCVCVLPLLHHEEEWPELRPGLVDPDPRQMLFIRQLQQMLIDGDFLDRDTPNGHYDAQTVAAVNAFRATKGELATGTVDAETWLLVRKNLCGPYDF